MIFHFTHKTIFYQFFQILFLDKSTFLTLFHYLSQGPGDLFIWVFFNWFIFESSSFRRLFIIKSSSTCERLEHFLQRLETYQETTSCKEQKTHKSYQRYRTDEIIMLRSSFEGKTNFIVSVIEDSEIFLKKRFTQNNERLFLFILLF